MPRDDGRGSRLIPTRPADSEGIAAAVEALHAGRLVLHPTETLVSLTGDPYCAEAAEAARRLKGYDTPRPFLCLVPDPGIARTLAADWPEAAERLSAAFWPGPLTIVVRAATGAPPAVTVGGTLAVRPASDPVSHALLAAWGGPLFSTSANRRGEPAPTRIEEAASALAGVAGAEAISLAIGPAASDPGPADPEGRPSSIVDLTEGARLAREGAIPLAELRRVWPEIR
jgi:L-threonylcarbamoyladenylate synthase